MSASIEVVEPNDVRLRGERPFAAIAGRDVTGDRRVEALLESSCEEQGEEVENARSEPGRKLLRMVRGRERMGNTILRI